MRLSKVCHSELSLSVWKLPCDLYTEMPDSVQDVTTNGLFHNALFVVPAPEWYVQLLGLKSGPKLSLDFSFTVSAHLLSSDFVLRLEAYSP